MDNFQQRMADLLNKAQDSKSKVASTTDQAANTNSDDKLTPEKSYKDFQSLKDLWRKMGSVDSHSTPVSSSKSKRSASKYNKSSSGKKQSWKSHQFNDKRPPIQVLGQFRRAKSSSILELFRDCKDKENTPPRMPSTPPRMSKYSSPSYSPLSDLSQSPLSSPLKRMAESPITQYFKRVDISKTVIKSTPAKSTPKKSESLMLISPSPKPVVTYKKEKVTISASVGIHHVSKSHVHVTPPTKSGINGYFHKVRGKHKKVSRYITEDKLHDVSPETLRVFAAARGGDISLYREYTMENLP
ncbi:22430_t:CDS:2 [Dentiscutata erythropus]|uniref:22430_t:CDS:1 n=1 Tax=Dentiscutata erythropus TaxID=1348616 RepID=A0A9N8ZTS9_9GLOM|nr:22430_t:CDS:2 [Dentiscutata erythropus]